MFILSSKIGYLSSATVRAWPSKCVKRSSRSRGEITGRTAASTWRDPQLTAQVPLSFPDRYRASVHWRRSLRLSFRAVRIGPSRMAGNRSPSRAGEWGKRRGWLPQTLRRALRCHGH